jgi:hypothetical protein
MLNPKIEEKASKLLFGGLINTFYVLADINSNANTSEERDLVRERTFERVFTPILRFLLTTYPCQPLARCSSPPAD